MKHKNPYSGKEVKSNAILQALLCPRGKKLTKFLYHTMVCGRERDNVVYWKTNGKINDDLQILFLKEKLGS